MIEAQHLDPECIFCRIIRGEIPCFKVHEDDETLSFMDINPIQPGHVLVIPKFHSKDIVETPAEWVGKSFTAAGRIAEAVDKTLEPYGMNILQANGPGAKQSVFHMHVHVIPRAKDDGLTMNWELVPGDMAEIETLAERIKANVP